jgi:hypothetical protein
VVNGWNISSLSVTLPGIQLSWAIFSYHKIILFDFLWNELANYHWTHQFLVERQAVFYSCLFPPIAFLHHGFHF